MNKSIINEIAQLKTQYDNSNNTYEIVLKKDFDAKEFTNILKKCRNQKWDDIDIQDSKLFINNNMILDVDANGNMKCYNKKMLKYKYIEDVKLNLYNQRKQNTDNFHCGLNTERYVQSVVNFKRGGINVILFTNLVNERNGKNTITITNRELVIRINNNEDENYLSSILSIFQ